MYACNSLGLELTPNRQRRLMDACLTLDMFPDVRPGLEALKQQGIRRAIWPTVSRTCCGRPPNMPGFWRCSTRSSASKSRIFKPSPLVYNLVSARMSVPAGDIGFVSSNSWDIAGRWRVRWIDDVLGSAGGR